MTDIEKIVKAIEALTNEVKKLRELATYQTISVPVYSLYQQQLYPTQPMQPLVSTMAINNPQVIPTTTCVNSQNTKGF